MTIAITSKKKDKIHGLCVNILSINKPKIRLVACLLGSISAAFEGVPFSRLHFRDLEQDKIISLKQYKGDFDQQCILFEKGVQNIKWWRNNIKIAV